MGSINYLGPKGTFTEEALSNFITHKSEFLQETLETDLTNCTEYVPAVSINAAIDALLKEQVQFTFVPIENSLGGTVMATLDYLSTNGDIEICAEVVLPIRHHLWTYPDAQSVDDITHVYSHPQALYQCQYFLLTHMPLAEEVEFPSTANAAAYVHEKRNLHYAAIGGPMLGGMYELKALCENIEDVHNNMTRFILIRKHKFVDLCDVDIQNKTSIVFEVDGLRPGSLYESLAIFAKRQINLVRIESRPTKGRLGEYKFFFDLDSTDDAENMRAALTELKNLASTFTLLGSYNVWEVK